MLNTPPVQRLTPPVLTFSPAVVFSLSARRWWYEVVVIVVVIAASYSSLLPPVTADLLGWFAAIWRYTKSHYSAGHGLEERVSGGGHMLGADQRGPAFTSCFLGRQRMGNAEVRSRGAARSDACHLRMGNFFGVFFFFFLPRKRRRKLCLHACTHARVYLSSRFPQRTIGPGGRERETKSE